MRKQVTNTRSERQLKLAEAGILFVLVLGIAIFVGTKVTSRSTVEGTSPTVVLESGPEFQTASGDIDPVIEEQHAESGDIMDAPKETFVSVEMEDTVEIPAVKPLQNVTYSQSEETYFAGDFAEAADLFAVYTREHPTNAWGHYMEGLSNWKAGEPEGAEESFVAALDIKPDHLKSLVNYGRVLLEMERADEAKIQLEAAVAVNPLDVDANRVLGRANHNLGLLDEAMVNYRAALAIKTDDVWALNNLGLVLIDQERFEDALPPLAKAVQLNQDIACIQNNLGIALERADHLKDSALAFERALAADQGYAKAEDSLKRINALITDRDVQVLDLELLAASFSTDPMQTVDTTEIPEVGPVPGEESIEVANSDTEKF